MLYRARIINPRPDGTCEDIQDGYLLVGPDGRIIGRGRWAEIEPRLIHEEGGCVNFGGNLILPGFIDLHLHYPQLDCRALYPGDLMRWLRQHIYHVEARFADTALARDTARRLLKELIGCGTTTAVIFSSVHTEATDILFEETASSGLRAVIGKTLMDDGEDTPADLKQDTQSAIEESVALCKKWHGTGCGKIFYAFSPRFALSCSEKLMTEAGDAARRLGAYVQTHVAEAREEIALVRQRFPHRENYADVYRAAGLLGERTILAHAIHLVEAEYRMLAETRTRIAYCPSSNFFLKSGVMNLKKMRQHGIPLGLGSDIGAGPSASLLSVMRDGIYMQPEWVRPQEMLSLATLGGAKALGLESRIGSLEKGKDADFIVTDPGVVNPRWHEIAENLDDVLSLLIFRGDERVVKRVYVQGQEITSSS